MFVFLERREHEAETVDGNIEDYDFSIKYYPGKVSVVADTMTENRLWHVCGEIGSLSNSKSWMWSFSRSGRV